MAIFIVFLTVFQYISVVVIRECTQNVIYGVKSEYLYDFWSLYKKA